MLRMNIGGAAVAAGEDALSHANNNAAETRYGQGMAAGGMMSDESSRRQKDIAEHSGSIVYSKRYYDDEFEYRHVILPKQIARYVPQSRLMAEDEWRALGVTQSPGWIHYMVHTPEPHILLFRREKDYQLKYPPAGGAIAG